MTLPVLLEANSDNELNATIQIWEALAEKVLIPGQPDYLLAAILAYNKYLLIQRCNAAFASMLIDYSTAPNLDYLVALLGVTRTAPQPATCTLRFTLVPGHGDLTLSAGTRVSSTDGKAVFEVDFNTLVDSEINSIDVTATCQTDGIIGNDYDIGTVSTIMDVQPYFSSCENTDVTSGGVEAETDEELRSRSKTASSIFSVAGPREAYIYFTKTVSPLICDVAIITATEDPGIAPGEVDVYALLDGGEIPNEALNTLIEATLSADNVRPLTDTVVVASPTAVEFTLTVNVTRLTSYAEPSSTIIATIETALEAFKIAKYSKLGLDIIASEIEAVCRVEGVYDIDLTITPPVGRSLTGRNLVIGLNEFGKMTAATVTVTGQNDG